MTLFFMTYSRWLMLTLRPVDIGKYFYCTCSELQAVIVFVPEILWLIELNICIKVHIDFCGIVEGILVEAGDCVNVFTSLHYVTSSIQSGFMLWLSNLTTNKLNNFIWFISICLNGSSDLKEYDISTYTLSTKNCWWDLSFVLPAQYIVLSVLFSFNSWFSRDNIFPFLFDEIFKKICYIT